MKKALLVISLTLVLCLLLGTVTVHADEPELEIRDIVTYVFSEENTKTTSCVFVSDLPDVPYIDPVDYMSTIFIDEFSQQKNGEGSYTVTAPNGTMVADVQEGTLSFDSFEKFSDNQQNKEGSTTHISFMVGYEDFYGELNGLVLDLGKYGIDMVEYNGKVYLPLPTICAMFSACYSNAEYIDGSIYYLHSMDDMSKDGYFDKSPVYSKLERSEKMAEFTYNNLCFSIDYFFGKPTNAAISTAIAEKGFDKALDEYDELTKKAKEKLQSTDVCDYLAALCVLAPYFYDGGHTALYVDPLIESGRYPDSAFVEEMAKRFNSGEDSFYSDALNGCYQCAAKADGRAPFLKARIQAYSAYEPVIKWDDQTYLLVSGDTAVFVFDSFDVDSAGQFKEALDYAAEHDLKNFVIDVSGNGGGFVAVAYYMMTSMLAKRTGSNEFHSYSENVTTGNIKEIITESDLNFDGEIDEKDKEVSYDMHFGVLTSEHSFSSGNLLPMLAYVNGIAVFGETSGGGACAIQKLYFADSHYIFMSSNYKFYVLSGEDVDLGAPVCRDLTKQNGDGTTDYSGLFEIDSFGDILDEFYACKEHTAGEPVKENETEPTCESEGTYEEVTYCTVCGEEISRETKHTDPLGHHFGEWVQTKAPTEEGKGEQTRTCERCGVKEIEEIPALGHTHKLTKVDKKDPTEKEDGNQEYYVCSECEKWFEDAEGEVEITDRNSVIIPATGTEEPPAPGDDSDLYMVIALSAAAVLGFVLVHTRKKRVSF